MKTKLPRTPEEIKDKIQKLNFHQQYTNPLLALLKGGFGGLILKASNQQLLKFIRLINEYKINCLVTTNKPHSDIKTWEHFITIEINKRDISHFI